MLYNMLMLVNCSPKVPVVQWLAHLFAGQRFYIRIPVVEKCSQTNFILHKVILYVKLTQVSQPYIQSHTYQLFGFSIILV